MSKVTLIFVGGNSKVDKLIKTFSPGEYSHVAIKILGSTLEALGVKDKSDLYPGVWLHSPNKYDNNPDAKFIEVDIPDLAGAEEVARRLVGKPYGYLDCINGGLHDLLGISVPADGEITDNCSETVTRVLTGGGLIVFPDISADCITPNTLYRGLTNGLATAI